MATVSLFCSVHLLRSTLTSIHFGEPYLVDRGESPTDFVGFSTAEGRHAIVGREFNIISVNMSYWFNSSKGHFSSVIHTFPTNCPHTCPTINALGTFINGSNQTSFLTKNSHSFTLDFANETLAMVGRQGPTSIFTGLPRPTHCSSTTNPPCQLRLGGSSSIVLPDGSYLKTAIVQLEAPVHTKRIPSWCRVTPSNRTSVVLYHSERGVHWKFRSFLALAKDYPESYEGPNEVNNLIRT